MGRYRQLAAAAQGAQERSLGGTRPLSYLVIQQVRKGDRPCVAGPRLDPNDPRIELYKRFGMNLEMPELRQQGQGSGFVITPVVVWSSGPEALQPDPQEVAEIHLVPLAELDRPGVPHLRRIPESDRPVISIPLVGTHIHAPTAAILFQLREVAIWGRTTRVAHYEQPVFAWR